MVAATVQRPRRNAAKNKRYDVDTIAEDDFRVNPESGDLDAAMSDAPSSDEEEYASGSKRLKTPKRAEKRARTRLAVVPDSFVENPLYRSLSNPDISPLNVALEWIENYCRDEESDGLEAITNLVNLVLRCCGCLYLLSPHDLANLDSASDTIDELAIAFSRQRAHEYPFISNNKDLRFFKANVLDFIGEVVALAHTKGLLYVAVDGKDADDSLASPLMSKILTWFLTLSACTVRPLRYVSTTILMSILVSLCKTMEEISSLLETHHRQLSNSRNKRQQSRTATIQTIVGELSHHQQTIKEYFNDIVEEALAYRYRDIDPMVRLQCITDLGECISICPDTFFTSSYLRYFGWLLLDPSLAVRNDTTRALRKLYKYASSKNGSSNPDFRLFSETYKKQILLMCLKDTDHSVRVNLIQILADMVKFNYLEYEEQIDTCLSLFRCIQLGFGFSKMHNERLVHETAKLVQAIHSQKVLQSTSGIDDIIQDIESTGYELTKAIKTKAMIEVFKDVESTETLSHEPEKVVEKHPITVICQVLYQFAFYHESWLFQVKCITDDLDKYDLNNKDIVVDELKVFFELMGDKERHIILEMVYGALKHILTKRKTPSSSVDCPEQVVFHLADQLESLSSFCKDMASTNVFTQIWNLILSGYSKLSDVQSTFISCSRPELSNTISCWLIKAFSDAPLQLSDDDYWYTFDQFFSIILADYDSLLSTEIKDSVNGFIRLKSEEINSILLVIEGFQGEDFNLCSTASSLLKLTKISDYIDVAGILGDTADSLVKHIVSKLISSASDPAIIEKYAQGPEGVFPNIKDFVKSVKVYLDFAFVILSLQTEKLLSDSSDTGPDFEIFSQLLKSLGSNAPSSEYCKLCNTSYFHGSTSEENYAYLAGVCNDLQLVFKTAYIHIFATCKHFEQKSREQELHSEFLSQFEQFQQDYNPVLGEVFLHCEAILGKLKDVELIRDAGETLYLFDSPMWLDSYPGVFFGKSAVASLHEELAEESDEERISELQGLIKAKSSVQKESEIWEAEKRLCMYTSMLYVMDNLGLLDSSLRTRIALNSSSLGGLFQKLVEQH